MRPTVITASWQSTSSRARPEQAKAVAIGWMGVDDGPYVWPLLVDCQVHADLTGHFPGPAKETAVEIGDHHVGSSDQSLADSGRGDKKPILVQTDGEVTRRTWSKAEAGEPSAKPDKFLAQFSFEAAFAVAHAFPLSLVRVSVGKMWNGSGLVRTVGFEVNAFCSVRQFFPNRSDAMKRCPAVRPPTSL